MDNRNNRSLTDEELYSLLKKLNVSSQFIGKDYLEFVEKVNQLNSTFGNPYDKQSMIDLTWFLLSLGVDIWDTDNRRIIEDAVYNKKELKEDKLEVDDSNNKEQLKLYIRKLMFDLGFKPSLNGFDIFFDAVLYLSEQDDIANLGKFIYPKLSEKYNLSIAAIERRLRTLITNAELKSFDSEICDVFYCFNKKVTVIKGLRLVTGYVKANFVPSHEKNNINNIDIEKMVSSAVSSLGIYPSVRGYQYLIDAVLYILKTDGVVSWLKLYRDIGEPYGVVYTNVESNINFAINMSSERYKQIVLGRVDSEQVSEVEKFVYRYTTTFTNSEFISFLVEYIKLNVDKSILDDYKNQKEIDVLKKVRKK